jgi:hypothetical protein
MVFISTAEMNKQQNSVTKEPIIIYQLLRPSYAQILSQEPRIQAPGTDILLSSFTVLYNNRQSCCFMLTLSLVSCKAKRMG